MWFIYIPEKDRMMYDWNHEDQFPYPDLGEWLTSGKDDNTMNDKGEPDSRDPKGLEHMVWYHSEPVSIRIQEVTPDGSWGGVPHVFNENSWPPMFSEGVASEEDWPDADNPVICEDKDADTKKE